MKTDYFCLCLIAVLDFGASFYISANHELTLDKNEPKTKFTRAFFERKQANDGTAEAWQTESKKKAAFRRKYQDSYLSYGSSQQVIYKMHPLCIICCEQLANEVMKPSKLLCHIQTKHSVLKDKLLQFFERKNVKLKDKRCY